MSRFHRAICSVLLTAAPGWAVETVIHITDRPAVWNGTTAIPPGVFGVHNLPLTAEVVNEWGIEGARHIWSDPTGEPLVPGSDQRIEGCHPSEPPPRNVTQVIDCFFDRYQPALVLKHVDWKDRLQKLGSTYGRRAKETGLTHTLEFWNEPYLNWASRPGVNYDGTYFDIEHAATGQPMTLRTTGERFEPLHWIEKRVAVRADTSEVHYLATRYADDYRSAKRYKVGDTWRPFEWKEGFEFDFRGTPCRLKTVWWGKDTTQASYYSASFNAEMYIRMLEVLGPAVKDAHPGVQLIAGWDCHQFSDDWQPFNTLTKPMIDRCWRWLDGVTEHHYGGDTRMVTAEYEVVTAYAQAKYGKALKMYNTECGGTADPEQPGVFNTNGTGAPAIANFTYMIRDIIHTLAYSPDKIASRAYHQPQHTPGGKEAFQFLKDLRGELRWVNELTSRLWCVASQRGETLCVVLFNDGHENRELTLQMDGQLSNVRRVEARAQGDGLLLDSTSLELIGGRATVRIGKRSALKILANCGEIANAKPVVRTQCYGDQVLAKVTPEQDITVRVNISEAERTDAKAALLRLAYQGLNPAHAQIFLNGHLLSFDPQGDAWLCERPVGLQQLNLNNELTFKAREGHAFQILAASLVLVK